MSYKNLEHSTDALIEVRAPNLTKAFEVAGKSVVQTIIDDSKIDESVQKKINAIGGNKGFVAPGLENKQFQDAADAQTDIANGKDPTCLLYTSPRPRDRTRSRMPSSA